MEEFSYTTGTARASRITMSYRDQDVDEASGQDRPAVKGITRATYREWRERNNVYTNGTASPEILGKEENRKFTLTIESETGEISMEFTGCLESGENGNNIFLVRGEPRLK